MQAVGGAAERQAWLNYARCRGSSEAGEGVVAGCRRAIRAGLRAAQLVVNLPAVTNQQAGGRVVSGMGNSRGEI